MGQSTKWLATVLSASMVAACGGGGAETLSSPSPTVSTSTSSPPSTIQSPTSSSAVSTSAGTDVSESSCPQSPLPATEGFDPFYQQWCEVAGIPVVAADVVAPAAMVVASEMLAELLAHRSDVAQELADSPVRVGLIGRVQQTTDMPEWSDLNEAFPETDWNQRARGLGATLDRPLVGAGEENLLCLAEDRYLGESIFVHEMTHTILEFGLEPVDPTFRPRLEAAYDASVVDGRWSDTYAMTNPDEYWAEAAQSFFDTNLANDFQHNDIDTRAELARYDPAIYDLLVEAFGERPWRPGCPDD